MSSILWFTLLQLLNVVLGTMRTVLTVKSTKHVAAIMNAISFTFYAAVVKLIGGQDIVVVLAVTFLTNIVGVYLANHLLERFKKDKLWEISVTGSSSEISVFKVYLDERNIGNHITKLHESDNFALHIFSKNQVESSIVKEFLSKELNMKYRVVEIEKKL